MVRLLRQRPPAPPQLLPSPIAWRQLLGEEELRCQELGFQAGIVSVEFGASGGAGPSTSRTEDALAAIKATIAWTDRIGETGSGAISILVTPINDIHQLERLANRVKRSLREAGIDAAVGFAHRRPATGLHAAAARADANAAVDHSRHIRLLD